MTEIEFPKTFPRIETERLVLRELTLNDTVAVFNNFSDPDVAKWFLEKPFTENEQANQIIGEFIDEFKQEKGLNWAITLKENGECVGTCSYSDVEICDRGEIGFDLAKELWGKGLMKEGLVAIIGYGFAVLALSKVDAHTYADNHRAIRLLEGLGFKLDKISKDSHYFSISREDWRMP